MPAFAFASVLLVGCSAKAETGDQKLARASKSFSALEFYTEKLPTGAQLETESSAECTKYPRSECSYLDRNQVSHYYYDGILVIKAVEVRRVGNASIAALGIETARSETDVLNLVSAFFGDAPLECGDVVQEVGENVERMDRRCDITLGSGWLTLSFYKDQLLGAQLTSSHFI